MTKETNTNREVIVGAKKRLVDRQQQKIPASAVTALATMQKPPKPILNIVTGKHVTLIGQITHSHTYDPVAAALHYARKGIDGIALFTDHKVYTRGMDDLLLVSRGVKNSAVICQDYVLNEYHVAEARACGASSLVLYASVLDAPTLRRVVSQAQRWQMSTIVQVATQQDLHYATRLSPHVVAIGEDPVFDRERDLPLLEALRPLLPYNMKIMPLGCIKTLIDAQLVLEQGVNAVIVHEQLINHQQDFKELQALLNSYSEW